MNDKINKIKAFLKRNKYDDIILGSGEKKKYVHEIINDYKSPDYKQLKKENEILKELLDSDELVNVFKKSGTHAECRRFWRNWLSIKTK